MFNFRTGLKFRSTKLVVGFCLYLLYWPLQAGPITLGLNLEFVDAGVNDESMDGGLGIQLGYEFSNMRDWQIGLLLERMESWTSQADLQLAGEMMYQSTSLFATARPHDWPLIFKVGLVDAEYRILLQDFTQNYHYANNLGYAYGVGLTYGNENFRVNLLDYKHIQIGSDSFNSIGITIAILSD